MEKNNQLEAIRDYVFTFFHRDVTGHDFDHMKRVAIMAKKIAEDIDADSFICEAAAWLHDIGDRKLFSNPEEAIKKMNIFLASISIEERQINEINRIIETVSYQKGLIPDSMEGQIVQDADRLDAIGAIGIARTFQFGGANEQMIYQPGQSNTSIEHFYDKLLNIKNLMHTDYAKEIAEERHMFMEAFLKQFYHEWQ